MVDFITWLKQKQFVILKLKTLGGSKEGGEVGWKSVHRLKMVGCVSDT